MAEINNDQPSASSSSIPARINPPSAPKPSKASSAENNIFDTCYQCRRKQISKPSLYLLPCMHSACKDCLTLKGTNTDDFFCKCQRSIPRKSIILVNRLICKKGRCQQNIVCKNDIRFHCNLCDLNICDECSRSHEGHQMAAPRLTPSCSTHPKMPAKYICGCGKQVCHACATGYMKEHIKHQKQTGLPPARVIDSCERFNKGICTLQNSTRVTFEIFANERNNLKKHFHNMRVDLAKKTMEVVNATLRKMNDCVLAMEMFEHSYLQKFEESEREHRSKQQTMVNFKRLCSNTADNNPLNEFLPFITDVSSQISSDVSNFTNKIVEAIKAYSHPPEFTFDTKTTLDAINASARFRFQGQLVTPPPRTDASENLINIPIEKLAAHPMVALSAGRKHGEKRKPGPLLDAMAAKKARENDTSSGGSRPYEFAGTTINRKTVPVTPVTRPIMSQPNVNLRFFSKPPSSQNEPQPQQQQQPQQRWPMPYDGIKYGPRENPKVPLNIRTPPVTRMNTPFVNTGPMSRGGFTMTRGGVPTTMANNVMVPRMPHSMMQNNQIQQQPPHPQPHHQQMHPNQMNQQMHIQHQQQQYTNHNIRPMFRPQGNGQQQHQPGSGGMMQNGIMGGGGNGMSAASMQHHQQQQPQQSLNKASVTATIKQGPPTMQKALMDIIKQTDNGMKQQNHSNPSSRSFAPSIPDNTRVITPVSNNAATSSANTSSNSPNQTSSSSSAANPPIKLTLRRNPLGASMSSDSPEKDTNRFPPPKIDDWEDYCFVCNQGCDEISGDLVCCETCPKVYHNVCHIPFINGDVKDLPDDWRCTRCKNVPPLNELSDKFTEREKLVCARVMLACYEKKADEIVPHSEPFHNPVPISLKRYYEMIKDPICFKEISHKVCSLEYQNIQQFIDDMNLVFKNCCTFNRKGTPIELSCRIVFDLYSTAVKHYLSPYHSKIWLYQNSPKV